MKKSQYIIANNITSKVNYYKIEEKNDFQQTKYIIWLQNANNN